MPKDTDAAEQPLMVVMLELKLMVPLGEYAPLSVSVAVKVTGWPNVEGFKLEPTEVEGVALLTRKKAQLLLLEL